MFPINKMVSSVFKGFIIGMMSLAVAMVIFIGQPVLATAAWPASDDQTVDNPTVNSSNTTDWWSLQPLLRPTVPEVTHNQWGRNAVDAFVLKKFTEHHISPSPDTDRLSLMRRATLDLTGLPPTIKDVKSFLEDPSPFAYEKLIDRLLASPRYGERWGRFWLDVVRYTESDGFENDKFRPHAWRYRDYVLNSFVFDRPYAEFVRQQLAGDVVLPLSREGLSGSGFLVSGPWDEIQNVGVSELERKRSHEEQMEELLATISQTFLGFTVQCARCHDHKFDPITQKDYYQFKAIFDGVDHSSDRVPGNAPFATPSELAENRQQREPLEKLRARYSEELLTVQECLPATVQFHDDLLNVPMVTGRFGQALATAEVHGTVVSKQSYHHDPLTVECWVKLESADQFNVFIANNHKDNPGHWELYSAPHSGHFSVYLPGFEPSTIQSNTSLTDNEWHFVAMQLSPAEVKLFVDGSCVKSQILESTDEPGAPTELYLGGYPPQKLTSHGFLDEVRLSRGLRSADSVPTVPMQADSATLGLWKFDTLDQNGFMDFAYTESTSKPLAPLFKRRDSLVAQLSYLEQQLKELTLPMIYIGVRKQPPVTRVLLRGDVTLPDQVVLPEGLSAIGRPAPDLTLNSESTDAERRIQFARWVTDPDNPLTARVMANRIWQYHFGTGLVTSASDFGKQGTLPSHPELLDWLACELLASGGSLKALHRTIMGSSTYRQSNQINADALRIDADGRLLWRFTPRRLEGEVVRDAMLAVSGELNYQYGGESFKPFTVTVFNTHFYHLFDSDQPAYNRRTIYRANVVTGRDPFLDALDCPVPGLTAARRLTTVTPLQSLALMNDSFITRQSERFAERVKRWSNGDLKKQVIIAFQLTLSRMPDDNELTTSWALVQKHGLSSLCWVLFNSSEFLYLR